MRSSVAAFESGHGCSRSDALLLAERAKYERAWALEEYRLANHGLAMWRAHRSIFPARIGSALDIGCGTGRLFAAWVAEGIDGYGVDFAGNALDADADRSRFSQQCLWAMAFPRRFHLGVCADVMEHLPPEKVAPALGCIAAACDMVVFKIANYPSAFGDGDLHLTLQPAEWWAAALAEFGTAVQLPAAERPGVAEYVFRLAVAA